MEVRNFSFQELADATNNFNSEYLVGYLGKFGQVYRAKLENSDQIVAIERMVENGPSAKKEFLVEVLMLSLLNHPNLIELIGYCSEGDERVLVHEYLPFGSLDQHLHESLSKQKPLDWYTRMNIALGVAKGLEYMHHCANPAVIYRNLKPSNILLDNDFKPKLSDFGLAKMGPTGDRTHVSATVKGTYGYSAPEYIETGRLSVKADVYSFGVVLLELITGRKAIDRSRCTEEQDLVSWAKNKLKDPTKSPELADPFLQGKFLAKDFNKAAAVAAMCLQEESGRPTMSKVVTTLMQLSADCIVSNSGLDEPVSSTTKNGRCCF